MEEKIIYVYCIANIKPKLNGLPAGEVGLKDLVDGLYFVDHRGLYAVVSKVRESEFGEENLKKNLADLEWLKAKASTHEKVIEEVMKGVCVIPFKFATLFKTESSLKAMLDQHREEFGKNIEYLTGKEEWGVKVYCDMDKFKENINISDEEVLKIDKEIDCASPGKAFLLKKKKEEVLKASISGRMNERIKYFFERLSQYSVQGRINRLFPKEVTERNDDMILNAAFLVDRNKVAELCKQVEFFKTQYEEAGIDFDLSGSWPPYNFCSTCGKTKTSIKSEAENE